MSVLTKVRLVKLKSPSCTQNRPTFKPQAVATLECEMMPAFLTEADNVKVS